MNRQDKLRLEVRAAVLKALGHPTRLFIVEEISDTPRCVNHLTGKIGADISTVSRHLAVLKNAGLVRAEKKGKQVFYKLRVPCALNFLDCVEAVLREQEKEFKNR